MWKSGRLKYFVTRFNLILEIKIKLWFNTE